MARVVAAVALAVVLAGCAAPTAPASPSGPAAGGGPGGAADRSGVTTPGGPGDPATDVLGWEDGYWHNDTVPVAADDGLNRSERRAVLARTMARVERIRGLEFERTVAVTVISRAEYRERTARDDVPDRLAAFQDAFWESLLLVGEDQSAADAFDVLYGTSVQGYYSPGGGGRIVLVSRDEGGTPSVDPGVLAHELVHALQEQHFETARERPGTDGTLARRGIVEGDANYVQHRYEERCGEEWSCIEVPEAPAADRPAGFDLGLFVTIFVPYSEGPALVESRYRAGGWAAVDAVYRDPPASTEQVIHPERYPDETPRHVPVPDRSDGPWSRFSDLPRGRSPTETAGEAALYAMLWANGAVERDHLGTDPDPVSAYNYSHPATDGWAGDAVVPYRSDDGDLGYVLKTVWDTPADAAEFRRAYRRALVGNLSATPHGDGVYVVPDGPFADAFRVTRDGRTVVVVNGPTVADLARIHPPDG